MKKTFFTLLLVTLLVSQTSPALAQTPTNTPTSTATSTATATPTGTPAPVSFTMNVSMITSYAGDMFNAFFPLAGFALGISLAVALVGFVRRVVQNAFEAREGGDPLI